MDEKLANLLAEDLEATDNSTNLDNETETEKTFLTREEEIT